MQQHILKYPEQEESEQTKFLDKIKIRSLAVDQNPIYWSQEWRLLNKCIKEFYPTIDKVEQVKIMEQKIAIGNYSMVEFILKPSQTIGPYDCLKRINIKINQQLSDQELHDVLGNFKINNNSIKQEFIEGNIIHLDAKNLLIQNASIPIKIQIYYEPDLENR
ncbi:hypothetical protein pb186bvf_000425 [Paramecium bursaria]